MNSQEGKRKSQTRSSFGKRRLTLVEELDRVFEIFGIPSTVVYINYDSNVSNNTIEIGILSVDPKSTKVELDQDGDPIVDYLSLDLMMDDPIKYVRPVVRN